MHNALSFLVAFLAFTTTSLQAQEKAWEMFDSSKGPQISRKTDAQAIYETLLKLIDAWNTHNIDEYLGGYWNSPQLLVVEDAEQLNGWQAVHDAYVKYYADKGSMGHVEPARIQVKVLAPNLASILMWLKLTFPKSKKQAQVSTSVLKKFDEGWKIVCFQGCSAELP